MEKIITYKIKINRGIEDGNFTILFIRNIFQIIKYQISKILSMLSTINFKLERVIYTYENIKLKKTLST